ncbi:MULTISPECIES: zinc ribbon domain-containing protein [Terrabacteria group]|uniref:zinc ribbon domain-containing protein n=1 Tax=Bacillati TaxID=1783272 RepID=UPI001C6E3A3B|nr:MULTISPECIES: zinc ribbon domain-containing protein [Terrabacteria group]MBW9212439.1 zinc ribbon domain-containing protein [Trueperella sp. zg.1013]
MNCKKCGAELADDAKFCTECGTPTEADTEVTKNEEVTEETKVETTEKVREEVAEKVEEVKEEEVKEVKPEVVPNQPLDAKYIGVKANKKWVPLIVVAGVVLVALIVWAVFFRGSKGNVYATCTTSQSQRGVNVQMKIDILGKAKDKMDKVRFDMDMETPLPAGKNITDVQMIGVQSALSEGKKELGKIPGFSEVDLSAKKNGNNLKMKMKFLVQYSKIDVQKLKKGKLSSGLSGQLSNYLNDSNVKMLRNLTNEDFVKQAKVQGIGCKVN